MNQILRRPQSLRNVLRRRHGSSVLEFVLVLPILLMLSFGIVDYGYFFYVKNTLQGAAEAGARAAIPSSATNTTVNAVISNMMTAAGLQGSGYTVTYSPTDVSTASPGTTVGVTINLTWGNVSFKALSSGYGGISNSKVVSGNAVMVKES